MRPAALRRASVAGHRQAPRGNRPCQSCFKTQSSRIGHGEVPQITVSGKFAWSKKTEIYILQTKSYLRLIAAVFPARRDR